MGTNINLPMRDTFFNALFAIAKKDKNVVLVTADCGAPSTDQFKEDLQSQYFTVGIAEQNMISIAAGLALEGKTVYVYAIAPFASLRCYEQIKVDLCCMKLPVNILGVGAGFAYDIMGATHHATEDISIMRALPNMTILNPSDGVMSGAFAQLSYSLPGPKYVRFDRTGIPLLYDKRQLDVSSGLVQLESGRDVCIIATGVMVHRALEVARELSRHSINAGVVDLFRLKPLNTEAILELINNCKKIVTFEEHLMTGGVGSAIAELICDKDIRGARLKRLGICDSYHFEYGGRENLHRICGLDAKAVTEKIVDWMAKENSFLTQREIKV